MQKILFAHSNRSPKLASNLQLMKKLIALVTFVFAGSQLTSSAWDYEGHRLVNQLGLSSLPANFPAFAKSPAAQERVAFLAGEPDRWRNTTDLSLQHSQEPEHFIDIEELAHCGFTPETLPILRYDFVSQIASAHKQHPEKFPAGRDDPAHKYVWCGLMPWTITENYAKLKSEFSYLKTFQQFGGTPEEIANAEANILYTMGVMGHHVGDAGQPLHTTIHHHGWATNQVANPQNYSTKSSIHSWIDGGYFAKIGGGDLNGMKKNIRPAQLVSFNGKPARTDEMFPAVIRFIVEQNKLVEQLYQYDKAGKFSGNGTVGMEGRAFLEGQLVKSGQLLGDIWFSAWQQATTDQFLQSQLAKRKLAEGASKTTAPTAPRNLRTQ